jgi:hypothetical protein
MSSDGAEFSIRRMTAADVGQVIEIAKSLKDAPQWPPAAYLAMLDSDGLPARIALVAEETNASSHAVVGFAIASVVRRCLMDELQDSTLSEEIDRLHAEHHRYAQRLEELIQKPYLSADEQLEEVRLKKLKLHAKDLIFALERRLPAIA